MTVLAWGINFPAIKLLYLEWQPPTVALLRAIPMYFLLLAVCKAQGLDLRYRGWPDAARVLGLGAISMGVYMVLFLEGMKRVTASEGAILLATSPLWTALLSGLAGIERIQPKTVAGFLIALSGVGLVVGKLDVSFSHWTGVALLLASALCWASSVVLSKPLMRDRKPLQLLTMSLPGCLVFLLPYGSVGALLTPFSSTSPVTWVCFAHITLLAGALGFFGFYKGVDDLGPTGAMQYQFFVTPVAMVATLVLHRDPIQLIQVVGAGLVLVGVYVSETARRQAL